MAASKACGWWVLVLWVAAAATGCSSTQPVSVHRGLRAVYPPQTVDLQKKAPVEVVVDSLQPTLAWEALPTEYDRSVNTPKALLRVTDVTYQIRIGSVYTDWSYSREGLSEPRHMVEVPLAPGEVYAWTVRACFRLDQQPRCTEWAAWNENEWRELSHPNVMSFRFKAPSS